MKNRITIAAAGPIGPTFLEWSIYFLSGQDVYCHQKLGVLPVTNNPLQSAATAYKNDPITFASQFKYFNNLNINAHNHNKNVCFGLDQLNTWIDYLDQQSSTDNIIWHQMLSYGPDLAKKFNLPVDEYHKKEVTDQHKTLLFQDFTDSVNLCLEKKYKVIHLSADPRIEFYFINSRRPHEGPMYQSDSNIKTTQDSINDNRKTFLSTADSAAWSTESMPVWDLREFLALNLRPYDTPMCSPRLTFDKTQSHYHLNCLEFWLNGDQELEKIMKFLELPLISDRYKQWKTIYQEWQKIQFRFLSFNNQAHDIVNAIVNNWHYEFEELTFAEEVTIQHLLLYKNGLNIKNWELVKFPTTARDLHLLLVPSEHNLEKLY